MDSSNNNISVINNAGYTIADFIERVSVNAKGNPILGDCLTYACVFADLFDGAVCMIFIPNRQSADEPMHAAVKIQDDYYDARGKITKQQLIDDQVETMRSDYPNYVNQNKITDIRTHVSSNVVEVDLNTARSTRGFNNDLYDSIYSDAEGEIKRIKQGKNLTEDRAHKRGPDF